MKFKILVIAVLIGVISCNQEAKKVQELKKTKKEVHLKNETIDFSDSKNMVFFKGGKILIGSNEGLANEKPVFEKKIEPFYLDKNLVTVKEFRKFIEQTGYKTDADKFGDSGVFSFEKNVWMLMPGANWEYPLGKSNKIAKDDYPVTQVSWNDAKAYAAWVGKRLPTEFEWEFAAKNGKSNGFKYAWGDKLVIEGKYMANVWQGSTIDDKKVLDGFLLTSPVGHYGIMESGLYDMGGNVWQWCENYFKPYPENNSVTPQNPNLKSTRGGSFMFDKALENSYTSTFRGSNSAETSLFNMGFRCAK